MRGATGVTLQPRQMLSLPRKMIRQNFKENVQKQVNRHFQCGDAPRMRPKPNTKTEQKKQKKKETQKKCVKTKGFGYQNKGRTKKTAKKQNSNSRTAGRTESKHKNGTEKAKNAKRKKKLENNMICAPFDGRRPPKDKPEEKQPKKI